MADDEDEPVFAFDSVWDALEDTPEEAAAMRARSGLAIAVREVVMGWGLPPAEAARRLGVTLPRLDDLLRGHLDRFTLEALMGLASRAGLDVRLDVTPTAKAA